MYKVCESSPRWTWINAARAITVPMAAVVGLLAAVACLWRPDTLAPLTLIPPWCWLVTGLVTTFGTWRAGRPRLAIAVAALWLLFAVGWVEEVHSFVRLAASNVTTTRIPAASSLRIVSLNCAGSERCLADLQAAGADVVLLQEAPGHDALARMTAALFGETGDFCTAGDVAILAGGPIDSKFAHESGTFVVARVQFPDQRVLHCVSLRLAPPPARLDAWSPDFWAEHCRLRQLHRHQLAQVVRAVSAEADSFAVVIGGDFNTTPLDASLAELRPHFTDAFTHSGVGWGATGTNDWPLFRVDQIWASATLVPMQTSAKKTEWSDHRMVVCDIDGGP